MFIVKYKCSQRKQGYAAPGTDALSDEWNTHDKFLIVVETASMSESELAEYARKKGLYVEQIKAWKDACMKGPDPFYSILPSENRSSMSQISSAAFL